MLPTTPGEPAAEPGPGEMLNGIIRDLLVLSTGMQPLLLTGLILAIQEMHSHAGYYETAGMTSGLLATCLRLMRVSGISTEEPVWTEAERSVVCCGSDAR